MDPLHPTSDQRDVVRWETAENRGGFCKGWEVEASESNPWTRFFWFTFDCFLCLTHAGVQ